MTTQNPNLTIRQLAGQAKQQANSDAVRQIFELDRAGDTAGAQAIYATLSPGMQKGVDNGRAARDGNLDPKSQAVVDATRSLYNSVKANDVEGTIAAFSTFSQKARPGVIKTLTSMVTSGRVTPTMAETIGKLAA